MKRIVLAVVLAATASARAQDTAGREISPWQKGMLDIHQISTGRGNAALYIFPDGTTLLVDTGELAAKTPRHTPDRPDGSRSAGEWVARYIQHALPGKTSLDYALLTHFHGDHMGGLARVGETLRIGTMLDRGWPAYDFPSPPADPGTANYRAFVKSQVAKGTKAERFIPGRNDQVVLRRDPRSFPTFEFRNVGANGEVWTGVGTATRQHFPALENVPKADWPDENVCSISFRLSYGKFDFFNGGDIRGIPYEGFPAWHDMETPVAKAVGPVDAAILNHHGYIDSQNEFFVSTLRPRVWLLSVWDSGHPTGRVWSRLQSTRVYPGPRDVFATDLHPATRQVVSGIEKLASDRGHIVLRVSPGGGEFRVVIVDDSSEGHRVTKVFGPYPSN